MRSLLVLSMVGLASAMGYNADALSNISALCLRGVEHCEALYTGVSDPGPTRVGPLRPAPFERRQVRMTNAQRLARGLPLNAPTRRQNVEPRDPESSPEPVQVVSGVAQLFSGSTSLGYISAATQGGGLYRVESSLMQAAVISVTKPTGATSGSGLRVTVSGSDISTSFPILGLVQGRDNVDANIGSGSYHYLYFAGVANPGSTRNTPPALLVNSYTATTQISRAAETDLWNIDFTTGVMLPQWINADGSTANTVLFVQGAVIYAGGDSAAFNTEYSETVTEITTIRLIL